MTGRRRWATGILTWGLIWGAVAAQPLALDFSPFAQPLAELADAGRRDDDARWLEADIPTLQAAMARGDLSAEALLVDYLDRIRRFDVDGLQAVLALNPEALALARRLDDERAAGASRGPLHGIPVLLKDNIATGDAMATTAGAHALRGWRAHRDAFLVQRLRRAGAVILGKANLSEWANYLDRRLPNGYSALGGQTRHPYGPFDPLGSSTGSAVAVSANLTAVAVGSETQGSIIQPARTNGVVGLKTSLGLVSRDYLIPLVDWMDVPGPLGRTVTDVALLLTALAGVDPADPATRDAAPLAGTDFTDALSLTAARQRRVGVELVDEADIAARLATYLGRYGEATDDTALTLEAWLRQRAAAQNAHHRAAMATLEGLGIDVVAVAQRQVPATPDIRPILEYGVKANLNRFLAAAQGPPVASLAAIIAHNRADPDARIPYGQDLLLAAQHTTITAAQYAALSGRNRETATRGLNALFDEAGIDVLITTTFAYAAAGFPALTVPSGVAPTGEPQGLVLIGRYLGELDLLAVGYAYEQATRARVPP